MKAIVVYESVYGNTRAIAEAIADGLGGVPAVAVQDMPPGSPGAELLVVGGPTHMHTMATARSHHAAAAGTGAAPSLEPGATLTIRDWIVDLPPAHGHLAAVFDTRLHRPRWLTGAASAVIDRRLRTAGYDVIGAASFVVEDSEGPVAPGELQRARAWAAGLVLSPQVATITTT